MATLTINGQQIPVDDRFLQLPREQQQKYVEEYVAKQQAGVAGDQMPAPDPSEQLTPRNQRRKEARSQMTQFVPPPSRILPWQDEITAGMATAVEAPVKYLTGNGSEGGFLDTVGDSYNENVQDLREQDKEAQERWGGWHTGANIIGGLGLAGPARGVAAGATAVPRAAPILPRTPRFEASIVQRTGKQIGIGGAYGAAYGSGEGENVGERIEGGAKGAGLGAAFGAGGQLLGEGVGAAVEHGIAPLWRTMRDPARQARVATTRSMADDVADAPTHLPERGLSQHEFDWAIDQGYPVGNIDRGSENVTGLADAAFQKSGQARNRFNDFIGERERAQLPMTERLIDSMLPQNNPGDIARRAANRRAGQAQVRPLYQAAEAHPMSQAMWDEGFSQMAGGHTMQQAMKEANKIRLDDAALNGANMVRNPFKERPVTRLNRETGQMEPTGETRMEIDPRLLELGFAPNLQYWDAVKRGLDRLIDNGTDKITRKTSDEARAALRAKEALVSRLDDLTVDSAPNSPTRGQSLYARARTAAGRYLGEDSAAEAGKKIYLQTRGNAKNSDLDSIYVQVRRWTPEEREEAAMSFLERLKDDMVGKARSQGGDAGHVDLSLNFLKNEKQRRAAEAILGPERLAQLETHNMIQRVMEYRNKSMKGNSRTWLRAAGEEVLAPVAVGGVGGALLTGSTDPSAMTWGGLLTMLGKQGGRGINHAMKRRLAPHIADELIDQNPQTYQEVIRSLSSDPQLRQYLKLITHPMRMMGAQWGN